MAILANVMIDGELWDYHVTRDGRVFSLKHGKVKELKLCKNHKGYNMATLWGNSKKRMVKVARLVALAYIENPKNKPEVDHINRIRTDDRVENLRWATRSENALNRGKFKSPNPLNYGQSKPVRCVETGVVYPSAMEIYRQLGFDCSNISACCRGKYKSSYGFHWEYVE